MAGRFLLVMGIMFIVRPINIGLSMWGAKKLNLRERAFLSWVAPRGIVAASMASLFALELAAHGREEGAAFLEVFTYSVIIGTVFFQGLSAPLVGKLLGVVQEKHKGWLIIGAHPLACRLALFIQKCGLPVILIDTNGRYVAQATRQGLTAICENALLMEFEHHPEIYRTGNVLAITPNQDLNILVSQRLEKVLPDASLYRWRSEAIKASVEADSHSGTPIWESLDLPRVATLDTEEAGGGIIRADGKASEIKNPERLLLSLSGDQLHVGTPPSGNDKDQEIKSLQFLPLASPLELNMAPNWVVVSGADNLDKLLHTLLGRLSETHPNLDKDDIHRHIMLQDADYSFMIGYEVGLPHAYSDKINQSCVLVAKLKKPMQCTHSDDAMRFIFLVISPKGEPKTHLAALSEISRFIMNDASRQAMLDAETAGDLFRLLAVGRDQ